MNKLPEKFVDLASKDPRFMEKWDFENNDFPPSLVPLRPHGASTTGTYRTAKITLKCSRDHRWTKSFDPYVKQVRIGCPKCTGTILSVGDNDLASQRPDLLSYFDYEKNQDIKPSEICINSEQRIWWQDPSCGHSYEIAIRNQNEKDPQCIRCPICTFRILHTGINDLKTLYPKLVEELWADENVIDPSKIMPENSVKALWKCPNGQPHLNTQCIDYRIRAPRSCTVCSGKELLLGYNDPLSINPDIESEWDTTLNEGVTLYDFTFAGGPAKKQRWWKCRNNPDHRSWSASTLLRVKGGGNCPSCWGQRSKLEAEIEDWLRVARPELGVIYNDKKVLGGRQEIDVWIPELRLGIEINGEFWHSEIRDPDNKIMHDRKQSCAKDQNIHLMILWEQFWQDDKEQVKKDILKTLDGYPIPSNYTYQYRRDNPSRRFPSNFQNE